MEHTAQIELANQADRVAVELCVDIQKGLIYNPAHDGEWMIKILGSCKK